jgi:hypothetical protein
MSSRYGLFQLTQMGDPHSPGKKFSLDEIHAAVTESESVGRSGKVFIAPNAEDD